MFVHEGMLGDADHAEVVNYDVNFVDGRFITSKIPVFNQMQMVVQKVDIRIMCTKF